MPLVAGSAVSVTASGFLLCPGVASPPLVPHGLVEVLVPLRGLLVAPRARSGRLGRASSAALGRAFACDRAGTDRRAEPRCSPPSGEELGRDQRLHPPVWPLGSRTLRRNGSYRPRGGVTPTHPCALVLLLSFRVACILDLPHLLPRYGRGAFDPPVPRVAYLSEARGHRTREPRRGNGGAASCERRGAPVRIALSGRGRRSVRPQGAGAPKAAQLATRGTGNKGVTQ